MHGAGGTATDQDGERDRGVAAPRPRYWAFLSYSHHDRRPAAKLHRAIEGYRLPASLVGRPGRFGPVPARLHPVFRDREELGADAVLGAAVESALAGSRALVVACSPAAAASRWVQAEIDAYARIRPSAPVLCVLLDGAPLGSRDGGQGTECLPPALRERFAPGAGIEGPAPVAVDLRPGGDGWRLGVQKLVAGLAGVPLDALVQRDAHRRHVRMAWLSASMASVALVFAGLSVVALQARDEARLQRAQAEGLVGFMLGDLRDRLEPVGRLDALDAVGARALAYYEAQDPRTLDDAALASRAAAERLIGEIESRRGDGAAALVAFERARDTTGEILARAPDDPARVFDHAQSVFWVGYHAWQHGNLDEAERAMLDYRDLAGRLVEADPRKPEWQLELASAHSNLGVMLLDQGRVDEAVVQFERSRRLQQALFDAGGTAAGAVELGQGLSWLSTALAMELRLGEATARRREEIALYGGLLEREPRNAVALERMALARRFLAELLRDAGQLADASSEAAIAARLAEGQLALEPDNAEWQLAAAKAWLLQAQLELLDGRADAAARRMHERRPLLEAWLAQNPEAWAWQVEVAGSMAHLASDLQREAGDRAAALATIIDALDRLEAAVREPAQQRKAVRWRAPATGRAARLLVELGRDDEARRHWRALVATGESTTAGAEVLAWQAAAHAALEDGPKAATLHARLEAAGYRPPAFPEAGDAPRVAINGGGP